MRSGDTALVVILRGEAQLELEATMGALES
jgi:hypothetical protein